MFRARLQQTGIGLCRAISLTVPCSLSILVKLAEAPSHTKLLLTNACLFERLCIVASGAVADDLDSFFSSAKPSAAQSQATSYAPSPANVASPAASLGIPDSQQDSDFFGSFGSPAQASGKSSAVHAQQPQQNPPPMDPFDLFGEGSTVPASAAASATASVRSQPAAADDGLFGDVEGHQGKHSAGPYAF